MTEVIDTKDLNVPSFLPELIANSSEPKGFWEQSALEEFTRRMGKRQGELYAHHYSIEVLTEEPDLMHCDLSNNVDLCHHIRVTFFKTDEKTVTTSPLMIEAVDFEDACEVLRSNGFVYEEGADYWFKEKAEPLQPQAAAIDVETTARVQGGNGSMQSIARNEEISKVMKPGAWQVFNSEGTDYKSLWGKFREIPVTDDEIQEPFLHFDKGTPVIDVWAWFDEKYEGGCHELMYGKKGNNK